MPDPTFYDYGIIGAGFAGLSLADALQETGQEIVIVEKNEPGSGASGTPGALVNPATGRKGKKSWKAESCYRAIHKNLQKVQRSTSDSFFQQNGVLRPAQTEKMARKMKKEYDKTQWPKDWCSWLTEDKIKQKHPGIHCVNGGLWLPIGMTVDGKKYCLAYADYLQANGVKIKTNYTPSLEPVDNHWLLYANSKTIRCKHLVFAAGYGTFKSNYWNDLNLEPIKGQLACFKTDRKLLFNHSFSGLGYVAKLADQHTFIQGSTYEHNFDHLKTDNDGADYLWRRLKNMAPTLANDATLINQWCGVRLSAPNRKPVIGQHPEYPNLYIFSGFGSKGLLYSKFVANHFSKHLTQQTPLFKDLSVDRLYA